MIPRPLRELAEEWDRFTPLSPAMERVATARFVLVTGPTWASVSGVRTDDVPGTLAEVRAAIRERGGRRTTWWIAPSSRPPDLDALLLELGLRRPEVAELAALALVREPAPGPSEIDVRAVETFEEFRTATEIRWEAFPIDAARRADEAAHLEELWEGARGGHAVTFIAFLDGRPAATALGVFGERGCVLVGGATLPWARGRGLYRALVRARWDEAVRRGTPGLAVGANPATSYRILLGLAFEEVARVRRLEDPG